MPINTEGLPLLIALGASWGAGACGAYAFVDLVRQARRARALVRGEIIVTETQSPFIRLFLPTARYIGRGVRANLESKREDAPGFYRIFHRRIQARLASAGNPEGIDADEYVGFVVLCTLAGGMLGTLLFLMAPFMNVIGLFGLGALLGALRMPGWLNTKRALRHNIIRKELPFALDLFTLATEAGLDFTSALDRIVRKLGATPL
ncbi:MAG: hypothetical protein ACOCX4_09865, partial [Planctomycetota bacterium]